MANTGVCCSRLEEPKALMKMGLCMVLLGHVSFLLGALVHGVVLRHAHPHQQPSALGHAVSNVLALTAGLLGVIVGILAIVLSKDTKSRTMMWSLFAVSLCAGLLAAASVIGLAVALVRTVVHGGRSLLAHCRFPDAIGYSGTTDECPFDPTRVYSTTLLLWAPLISTSLVQMVFAARCVAVCLSFLGLTRCPPPRASSSSPHTISVVSPTDGPAVPPTIPLLHHHHHHHHRHPQSERQPLHHLQPEPERERTRPPDQNELLEPQHLQRSSFWV